MPPPDEELFARALEHPADERERYVATAVDDAAQRERILILLRAHLKAERQLRPAQVRLLDPGAGHEGAIIGRYKLLEKIGEGGCGEVWMAQQDEPVRRRVALKVIKLGMDTKEVIARFEAERQALALMEHPNIARVFDAGATENGRPYFVMELVHGHPITRYCDERGVSMPERLALFVQVCRALQHAHEKGVVHRDIKPSNILVTRDGDVAVPKVIDFGIAKATQGRLTDRTLFTAFEQFIGTPAYMSPEQADLHAQEIDARSDVYSLGALLYELLAGRPPFDPKTLAATGIEEVRRIIREVDPPRPSTRLHTLSPAGRTSLAARRQAAPVGHAQSVTGDLDWITMKALEKSRARRYESAAELAADVARYLEHKPVSARPPSPGYVVQKFIRRHRLAVTAAAAVLGVALVGGVIIFRQTRRAEQAEHAHASLAAEVASAVAQVDSGAGPPVPAPAARELAAARQLATQLRDNFFAELPGQERIDELDGQAMRALAAFDGVPAAKRTPEMERERAYVMVRVALAHRRRLKPSMISRTSAAVAAAEKIYQTDRSEDALLLQACAQIVRFDTDVISPAAREGLRRAAALLRAPALVPDASLRVRVHFAEALMAQAIHETGDGASKVLTEARQILESLELAAQRRTDVRMLRGSIICQMWRSSGSRSGLAEGWQEDVLRTADELQRERPASIDAVRLRRAVHLAELAQARVQRNFEAEFAALSKTDSAAHAVVTRDPAQEMEWRLFVSIREGLSRIHLEFGRIEAAAAVLRSTLTEGGLNVMADNPPTRAGRRFLRPLVWALAVLEAERGNGAAARHIALARLAYAPYAGTRTGLSDLAEHLRRPTMLAAEDRRLSLLLGADADVLEKGEATLAQLLSLLRRPDVTEADRRLFLPEIASVQEHLARAHLRARRWAEAEAALTLPPDITPVATATRVALHARWLGLSLAKQGRGDEAMAVLTTAQNALRPKVRRGTASLAERQDFALGLLVEAIAQAPTEAGRARRRTALAEAQKIVDALPEGSRQLYQPRLLITWLAEERARG